MGLKDRIVGFVGDILAEAQAVNTGNYGSQSSQSPSPVTYPLNQQASVYLSAAGNGSASCGPQLPRQHWQPTAVSVSVATNVSEATCKVYYGTTIGQGTFLGSTAKGSTGDTCGIAGIDLPPGALIWAQWANGDANQQATMVVQGQYTTGAPQ